jgi:acid phosphatase type 7
MPLRACGALALLLVLAGCDKLRALPGFEPAPAPPPPSVPVAMGPWLIEPLPGRVTVAWTTLEASLGRVWYGTAETDRLAMEEGGAPVTDHRVVLPSLQPSTQYRYRVEGGHETSWFTSAPQPDGEGPIRVVVYGDNRTNGGDHALVARAAAAERPQLALHTGNMVASARENSLWRVWFEEERDLLAHAPIVATKGNQEIADTGAAYARFFQRRDRPPYASLDYGPVHVVVLDAFEMRAGATPHLGGVSDVQKAWFEEDVRGVSPDRHVWVLVHQGPFAHPAENDKQGNGGSEEVRAAIAAAHKIHPIEAVFAGHHPFYERGEIDGIRYLVLGGGGAPLEEPDATFPGVQAAAPALSYASVEVCGCHTRGAVKDIAGKVIDAFTLAECAKPCSVPFAPQAVAASSSASTRSADDSRSSRRRSRKRRKRSVDEGTSAAENRDR